MARILVIFILLTQNALSIEAPGVKRQVLIKEQPFFWQLRGNFLVSRTLKKGETAVPKFLHKYYVKELVEGDRNAYELALKHESYAESANLFLYSLIGSAVITGVGTFMDKGAVQVVGGLFALLSIGPYFYYQTKASNSLQNMINKYNLYREDPTSSLEGPRFGYSWSF